MSDEFSTEVVRRLRLFLDLPPDAVGEAVVAYKQGGPRPGTVTYTVGFDPGGAGLNRLMSVSIDVDVWARGPDFTEAEDLADAIERALIDWRVNTARQGTVRINGFSRAYIKNENEKTAHITMRFTGRAFRRLDQ